MAVGFLIEECLRHIGELPYDGNALGGVEHLAATQCFLDDHVNDIVAIVRVVLESDGHLVGFPIDFVVETNGVLRSFAVLSRGGLDGIDPSD
jgi:hypothetical protein